MPNIPVFEPKSGLSGREASFVLIALALSIAINPIGYVGGGSDDFYYLMAAQCWQEGPCVGDTHWSTRWPLLAPTSLFLPHVWVVPILYSILFVLCIAGLGNALLGRPVGTIAAGLVILMPSVSTDWTTLAVAIPEAAFLLAAAWIIVSRPNLLLLAGMSFGMAVATRLTATVAAPAFLFLLLTYRRSALPFVAGLAVPILGDIGLNWWLTGDPWHRFSTALAHTTITSEALSTGTEAASPILNVRLISSWNRLVSVHWLIDPPLNLAINPRAGVAIVMGLLAAPLARPGRCAAWVALIAAGWFVGLAYVLAVSPGPRVMLMPLVLAHLAFAAVLFALWQKGKKALVGFIVAVAASSGLFIHYTEPRIWPVREEVKLWIEDGPVQTTETVRRHFPNSRNLQLEEAPRSLYRIQGKCEEETELDVPLQRQIAGLPANPYRLCGMSPQSRERK